jgi:hypothetical protein
MSSSVASAGSKISDASPRATPNSPETKDKKMLLERTLPLSGIFAFTPVTDCIYMFAVGDMMGTSKLLMNIALAFTTRSVIFLRLIHVPDVKMRKARHACTADATYLQQLWYHIIDVDVLSERDRSIIVGGLERHFRNRI